MDEIVDLVLVNRTFPGEQWTQGHVLMCGSHPAVDADCSCASCPPEARLLSLWGPAVSSLP